MSFIGIVANKKFFENIKGKILEECNESINFIQINLRSIENIKNIKFETVIFEDNINKFKESKEILEKICELAKYILINTDKNIECEELIKLDKTITYGLNQKATVTVSSISDTDILIYLQRKILNIEENTIDIEERRIKRKEKSIFKTYEILVIYTFLKLYNDEILKEI